jgi:hypothetical protein
MVLPQGDKSQVYTQMEWDNNRTPAFELHAKLGLFCKGVQVIGHQLEPIEADVPADATVAAH